MLKHQHKILFVDDELENLKLTERALRQAHTVLMADTPQAAFEILAQHEISLVASDQRMPEMSGLDFLAEVRNRSPHTIRFLLTGLIESDEIQNAINNDLVYGYIIKPYKLADFRLTITRALEHYELLQENLRLRQDWQQTSQETSALLTAGSALTSSKDVTHILDRIVTVVCNDFGYQACSIELIDKNSWEIFIKASHGFPAETKQKQLPIEGPGVVSYVARTGKLTYLPDVSGDERYIADNPDTRSQLAIPLRVGEDIIGVFNIESSKLAAFSERDVLLFSSFADKAAAIVQQAHLFDMVSRGKAEWETTFDAIADGIFIFDRKRRLTRVNSAGAQLLDRHYDQLLGQFCCSIFPDEERIGCLTRRVFSEGQRIIDKDGFSVGSTINTVTADPIRDENHEVLGCVITVRAQS